MANTYHQIYLQTVYAVNYRQAVLDKTWRSKVQGVIGNLINETGCKTIIVNAVEDHMHCFLGLRPAVSVSELMKTVKTKSFKYINDLKMTKKGLNGRKAMVFFLTGSGMLTKYISIFRTRKSIIKKNHSGKNTRIY